MKQLIVLAASVLLAVVLWLLIAGPSENSIYSGVKGVWQSELEYKRSMEY